MWGLRKTGAFAIGVAISFSARTAQGNPEFIDNFSAPNSYSSATPSGDYTVTDGADSFDDGTLASTWTAGGGQLSYSRSTGPTSDFNYESSVLLTTPAAASTVGLTAFTVTGAINDIPASGTSQAGLIISGNLTSGGYLLTEYTGDSNHFVILAETGSELLGDEGNGGPATIVQDLDQNGTPLIGHDYTFSVTEDRSGAVSPGEANFAVNILDLGPTGDHTAVPFVFYAGSFADTTPGDGLNFGEGQIGYRVRDSHDDDVTPTFGALSLIGVPEPSVLSLAALSLIISLRRPAVAACCRDKGVHPRANR